MKYILVFLLNCIWLISSNGQVFTSSTIDSLSQYIFNLQYPDNTLPSYGAIKKTNNPGIFSGQYYYYIQSYFDNSACLGMLKSSHPDKCGFVMRWMNWYLAHLNSYGQTLNYYYKPDGTGETTCPPGATGADCNFIDAEDSDPTLFWIVAYEYYLTTNDLSFFTSPVKYKLENAAQFVIDSLIQSDNLSFAKRSYAIKYTMDNSEVYKGFLSLSNIEAAIFNDVLKANLYLSIAGNIRAAIQTLLYNNATQLYDNYLGGTTDSTHWYSNYGITAAIWPQLFNVDSINDIRSIHQRTVLNNNFDGTLNPDWTTSSFLGTVDDFTWASIGYVFSSANDTLKGFKQANYISGVFKYPFPYPPCYVTDAGWAILNMSIKYPPSSGCSILRVTDDHAPEFLIYPNPASSYLYIRIKGDTRTDEMCIYNSQGNLVVKQTFSSYIDISQLQPGMYFIRIIGELTDNSYSGIFNINR